MNASATPNTTQTNNNEISLKELILKIREWVRYLRSKWMFIILAGVIGGIIGFVYASLHKTTYKAVMTFVLEEDKGGGMSGALGLASSFGFDVNGGGEGLFSNANIIELMKSRYVIEKTLLSPVLVKERQISLADYYVQVNNMSEGWDKTPRTRNLAFPYNLERDKFSLVQDSVLKGIGDGIVKNNLIIAQKDKKVSIITLEVKTIDEEFSKLFCEQLAKVTSEFYIETKSKKAKINVDILQKQADSIRKELNGAIIDVASASDNVYNLNPALNIKRTSGTKKQIDVQANTVMLTQLVGQLELAKVTLRKETPLIQVVDQPILPLEKKDPEKLKSLIIGGILGFFLIAFFLISFNSCRKMFE